ncbi:LacI family DNA-binding transcriptional regulator [Catenovulum maritimum]|uniref:LacI family transcriptional regulator n=1 Tax=Catenovulum maritimum TaxID=1513271 RepID=A0A0J8GT27_9ALTE|nr:LacI family DNA-binding transcriptional regulator [Catenovulum maritimum]KMT64444.1 LacI family transcriptional regulator [Catenovulum maritimum]
MTTIKEVSELAGVSLATVSRVMNGSDQVTQRTKDKVKKAMETLGYRPNTMAQSLASGKSNSIGMMISELHGPFYGPLMSGAEKVIRQANKQFLVVASHGDENSEKKAIDYLLGCKCDGLILHSETLSDEELIKISESGIEIVLINRYVKGLEDKCMSIDNVKGSKISTEWLIENGHTKIACILGPQWKHDARERFWGYQHALTDARIPLDPTLLVSGDFQESGGREGVKQLLDAKKEFTAILCGNDETAFGAIEELTNRGIKVPEDISVIGFDDVQFSRMISPKLTTIRYPIYDVGLEASAEILAKVYQIKNAIPDGEKVHGIFEPQLISRESVKNIKS